VTATLFEKWPTATGAPAGLKAFAASVKSGELSAERDEAAAEVFSIGYFTTCRSSSDFLYSPLMVVFLSFFDFIEFGTIFTTASSGVHHRRFFLYLLPSSRPSPACSGS